MNAKVVTKIDANPLLARGKNENALLKVAAYARVSTDSEDQLESYKAQVAHYSEAIAKNPHWRFVEVYADEGITGTQAKKRKNFMRMIRDCEKGKIDLILTKSIARFARNTVDSLRYIRELKAHGVSVFFEEQNINSMNVDSEMLIGFHSVLAQAESENISANVRWGIQQRMKSGTFTFRYNILGYRKGEDGEPEVVPEEAEVIKAIFNKFLEGDSVDQIKSYLESNGIKAKNGKNTWSKQAIHNILENERYTGDMLMQKTYIENCLTKKVKKNRGEMAKYLIVNNHPAIIDKTIFKRTQMEIARRSNKRSVSDKSITGKGRYSGRYALTDLLVCGECGSPYRRRTWTKNGKRKKVWRCLSRVEYGTQFCKNSISVDEEKLYEAIRRGMKQAVNRKDILSLITANLSYSLTGDAQTLDIYAMEQEIKTLTEMSADYIRIMSATEGNKEMYVAEIKKINERITVLRERLEQTKDIIAANESQRVKLDEMKTEISELCDNPDLTTNSELRRMIEYIRIMGEGKIIIVLKNGIQVEEKL